MTNKELLSASLLEILFDGRNKDYGAYELRRFYNNRLLLSLVIGLSLACLLIVVSGFSGGNKKVLMPVKAKDSVVLKTYTIPEQPKPEPPPVAKMQVAPAAPPVATVAYPPIKIVPDEKDDPDPVKEQLELEGKQIAAADAAGEKYEKGQVLQLPAGTASVTTEVAAAPEHPLPSSQPEFPGGHDALMKFLFRNLATPDELQNGDKKTVRAKFLVDKDGTVSLVEIASSGGHLFDKEVIRVCKKMPRWKPALQNGRPIAVSYVLPVTFIGVEN